MSPFVIVQTHKEEGDVKELITIVSEYMNALLVEMKRLPGGTFHLPTKLSR